MSDSLKSSMDKIKNNTAKLNKITDEAAQVIHKTEAFLSKDCGIGIMAHVNVFTEVIDPDKQLTGSITLGYERWNGTYRIVVSSGVDGETETWSTKPWAECDRSTKLESIKKLPSLIELLAKIVSRDAEEAHAATTSVAEVLKAIERKESK